MALSKKDYELIAKVIRTEIELSTAEFEPHHVDAYREISVKLAHAFMAQSPTFNPEKFIQACQPTNPA